MIATDLAREQEEQRRWQLHRRYAGVKVFDRLVENEFLSERALQARQARALQRAVRYAATHIPYYRALFEARKLRPRDIRTVTDLAKLPLLGKGLVRDNENALRPARLPKGEQIFGVFSSSGTTGRPTRVVYTVSNNTLFTYLSQRNYRWFRFDPSATLAFIRLASQLPRQPDRRPYPNGVTCRMPRWRYVGTFFETGPWLGFNVTNPIEEQIAWLREQRPTYLGAYSESLEHLCFAANGQTPADSIEGTLAISEQLTPSMRRRIERTFAAPVHQSYGLNEIGLVAVRCAAGRYHVHTEHCLVEIVDEDGQPCAPGRTGRIVITALRNAAMPLVRYDTDDIAEAAAGPCPCGRTLPSFGKIMGRYSRIAFLPEGTLAFVGAVREALETMPDEFARNLRRFQVHQFRDDRFELRLATVGEMPPAFAARIRAAWRDATGDRVVPLSIVEVDDIPRTTGGKFQDFTSDHMPAPDRDGGTDGSGR